jgi:hypothetical protein
MKAALSARIFRRKKRAFHQTAERFGAATALYAQVPASNLSREIWLL